MNESIPYSDLIHIYFDPLAPGCFQKEAKFQVDQASGLYLHTFINLQILEVSTSIADI
jgi:hypothetical protein